MDIAYAREINKILKRYKEDMQEIADMIGVRAKSYDGDRVMSTPTGGSRDLEAIERIAKLKPVIAYYEDVLAKARRYAYAEIMAAELDDDTKRCGIEYYVKCHNVISIVDKKCPEGTKEERRRERSRINRKIKKIKKACLRTPIGDIV